MEDRLLYRVTEVVVFLNVSRSRSSPRSPLPTCRGCRSPSSPTANNDHLRRPYGPCVQEPLTDVLIFLRADVAAVGRTGGRVLDAGTVEPRVHNRP